MTAVDLARSAATTDFDEAKADRVQWDDTFPKVHAHVSELAAQFPSSFQAGLLTGSDFDEERLGDVSLFRVKASDDCGS